MATTALRPLAPPAAPAVGLERAKLHLRVDGDAEDETILALAAAAADLAGAAAGLAWADAPFEALLDGLPADGRLELPRGPIRSVESISRRDADGALRPLDPASYRAVPGTRLVVRAEGASWPATSGRDDAVAVAFTAGFGPGSDDVPPRAAAAILLILADLFEHRGDDDRRLADAFPVAATALLASLGGIRYA